MTRNYKIDVVNHVLANSEEIREWYANEHNATADDFTSQNVSLYGTNGMGDLADMIISDGVDAGLISQEQADLEDAV